MKVIASTGREDIAMVYIIETDDGNLIECVESLQPPLPRQEKWVLLVSTMYGCPVGCKMCDAGGYYKGKPSRKVILDQIDFLVRQRYPDGRVPCEQWKIQFARMGEPALNPAVLAVLDELPGLYHAPGLMPSVSTIAPRGADRFFERLLEIKRKNYTGGNFQFQFSIHTTDLELRDQLIPVKKWSFAEMAAYGERFYSPGDRKITLNFALSRDMPVDPAVLNEYFDPARFLIKITPLNPTYRALENRLASYIDPNRQADDDPLVQSLRAAGYQVIVSIGELEENQIGSNCGQYIKRHLSAENPILDGYTYCVQDYSGT
jgi:23S rRNA (adenine2503-C2)-methyltransferase